MWHVFFGDVFLHFPAESSRISFKIPYSRHKILYSRHILLPICILVFYPPLFIILKLSAIRSTGMSDDGKSKTSKYIGPYGKLFRVNLQIGNKICLDIGNKTYMLEQCWNVEKYIPKMRKKYLRRK
jgi:hypothetical protein